MNNLAGLTNHEVQERKNNGLVNYEVKMQTKSIKSIIMSNSITLFNILNLSLGLAIILVGSYKNLLFLGIVILNTIIGITEEIKAKITLDRLKILVSNEALVLREGNLKTIHANEIVMDDIIKYETGYEVLVDSKVVSGSILVNESLVTGEATPILKNINDSLIAGSFIISGNAYAKVIAIGNDTYTSKIYNKASKIKSNNSIIISTLNKFIKVISILIIPIGLILFYKQCQIDFNLTDAVISTVAALVGMIPDGLILLSSTVFLLAALKLVKKNILVTDLNCIDSLSIIDTFCFDKTGTITNNDMHVKDVISLNKKYDLNKILSCYALNSKDNNETLLALNNYFKIKSNLKVTYKIPFNSINKYSVITIDTIGTFIIGANEVINNIDISKYEKDSRVLAIGYIKDFKLPLKQSNIETIGLVLLENTLKENANEVITNLIKKDVDVKLISGDSKPYLESIALKVGFMNVKCYDFSNKKNINYDELVDYNAFARATPDDKLNLINAFKKNHKVAMMGDGVNDVLALKAADASISLINATSVAKNASKIILLSDDFRSINEVISQGRKTINNLARSATLFINKTIYSFLLAILFIFANNCYPFKPIQLTLNNFVLIGLPSFILSLLPNQEKVKKNFIKEVLKNSIPSALIIFINIVILLIMNNNYNISNYISTMSFYLVTFNGFLLLYKICYPFNKLTICLNISLLFIYLFGIIVMDNFFEIVMLPNYLYLFLIIMFLISICLFRIFNMILVKRIK